MTGISRNYIEGKEKYRKIVLKDKKKHEQIKGKKIISYLEIMIKEGIGITIISIHRQTGMSLRYLKKQENKIWIKKTINQLS
ncbi:hypothetical protein CEE45_05195 [Candidatus Heimdallarchaeota archaeon B3_Heim]|nr:MAG: hypothetical protein CEE45_05195 [Candidatus Heimdallarchaeota archaeon B3_Heim]